MVGIHTLCNSKYKPPLHPAALHPDNQKKKHTQKKTQTINKPKQIGNKCKTPYVPLFWFDERTFYILMSPLRFRMLTLFCLELWFFSRIFQDFW